MLCPRPSWAFAGTLAPRRQRGGAAMSDKPTAGRPVCFVDIPVGSKVDPRSGIEIHFDDIYESGIVPALAQAGFEPVRGEQDATGDLIHSAMLARLLVSEFVVIDLTTANPNVFYELGLRHTARPYATIPIFATVCDPPFDVTLLQAIPYDVEGGRLTTAGAQRLHTTLLERIERAVEGPVAEDSPLFQLFDEFPAIDMSHQVTDVFRDRAQYSDDFRAKLAAAKSKGVDGLRGVEAELGVLASAERGTLMDLYLTYRDVEDGFAEMVRLYDELPSELQESLVVRQQLALALNRRHQPGDVDKALGILNVLLNEFGGSAETYGILGRVHKDRFRTAQAAGDAAAAVAALDDAIDAYTNGFEIEPADYYPGVNAVNLLVQKGTTEAQAEADRLVPLVTFAAVRQGGAESNDYWTVATLLELAIIGRDDALADRVLARLIATKAEPWMLQTTAGNLEMVLELRKGKEPIQMVERAVTELRSHTS